MMKHVRLHCGCHFAADTAARRYVSDRCAHHRFVDRKGNQREPLSHSLYRVVEQFGEEEDGAR